MSFGRFLARITAPLVDEPERRDVEALIDMVRSTDCDRIETVARGERVNLIGRIRAVVVGSGPDHPGMTAELFDGTGTVELCWIGRRSVPGIETGRHLRVTGRVGLRKGRPLMFNPRYELLAGPPGRALEVKHA